MAGVYLTCGTAIVSLFVLYKFDQSNLKEIDRNLPRIDQLITQADTMLPHTSQEKVFMVRKTEYDVIRSVKDEMEAIKEDQVAYKSRTPILRALFPPPNGLEIVNYVLFQIAIEDDGECYPKFWKVIEKN
jgi:hypothetical protein